MPIAITAVLALAGCSQASEPQPPDQQPESAEGSEAPPEPEDTTDEESAPAEPMPEGDICAALLPLHTYLSEVPDILAGDREFDKATAQEAFLGYEEVIDDLPAELQQRYVSISNMASLPGMEETFGTGDDLEDFLRLYDESAEKAFPALEETIRDECDVPDTWPEG